MNTIILPRLEYETLRKKANAYEELAWLFFKKTRVDVMDDVVSDFRKTGLYSEEFLFDLKTGLEQSSRSKK